MSEPNAGSDLASLTTSARRDGDDWVINGQKIWTSFGEVADYCYLICRTSNEGPPHAGISEIVVPMDTPGIEVRPITDMTTNRHFCEVFFTDVRVPAANLVGTEGAAFKQTMRQLEHERGGIDRLVSNHALYLDRARSGPTRRPARPPGDRRARDRLPDRPDPRRARGAEAGAAGFSAATKCFCTEHEWRVAEFVARVLGPEATLWDDVTARPDLRARLHDHGRHLERDAQHPRRTGPRPAEGTAFPPADPAAPLTPLTPLTPPPLRSLLTPGHEPPDHEPRPSSARQRAQNCRIREALAHIRIVLVHRLTPALAGQLGLVTRMQARSVGVGPRELHRMVTRGDLVAVHRDIFRHPAAPHSTDQRRFAAVLAAGPGAALSHRSAADLIGVSRFRADIVEVSRPTSSIIRLEGVQVHRIPDLAPSDIRRVGDFDVTSPARTVVDLGLVARRPFVQRVMEQWLANKVVTFDELEAVLDRVGRQGRNGAGVLRSILADRALGATVADSVPEGALGELLLEADFRHSRIITSSVLPNGTTFELDWSYPTVCSASRSTGTASISAPTTPSNTIDYGATNSRSTDGGSSSSPGPRSYGVRTSSSTRCGGR